MPTTKKTTKKVRRTTQAKATEVKTNKDVAELNVERMKLSQLKPHPRNPRKHPAKGSPEWEVLRKSLEYDYFDPLVWNKRNGMLVSGHLRRKVFTEIGVKSADVVVVDYDETTHLARMIAANKPIGSDDLVKLGEIFGELGAIEEFDLSLAGFTADELAMLEEEKEESDAAEGAYGSGEIERTASFVASMIEQIENPTHPVAPKQVWSMGKHTLICCDPVTEHHLFTPYLKKGTVLFICPDPLLFLDFFQDHHTIIAVQPDEVLAGYMLSGFIKAFGEKEVKKL
jgi:hypothetical protein